MRAAGLAAAAILLAAAAPASPPLLIQAEAQMLAPFCTGRDVQVEGNHNIVALAGRCQSLLVKGVANTVTLDLGPEAPIRIEGADNRITYRAPMAAHVEALGPDIAVTSVIPAPQTGQTLALDGSDRVLAADCTGRDVTVRGERSFYLLRGGCRSLSIRGDMAVVQAELQPGAPVSVAGQGARLGFVQVGAGRPPVVTLHGEGSHSVRLDAIAGLPR